MRVDLTVQRYTYDAWLGHVSATYYKVAQHQRFGQHYYNSLPDDIAQLIVATRFDPFYMDDVPQFVHDKVRRMWEKFSGEILD